jgi:hypothetical protein|tara:strand:+ start:983 stop:1189 length:207 start_codon:yes stop_codon:yes gene_type:complete
MFIKKFVNNWSYEILSLIFWYSAWTLFDTIFELYNVSIKNKIIILLVSLAISITIINLTPKMLKFKIF